MSRRAELSDALVNFFTSGDDITDMICVKYAPEALEALWHHHGADIVDEWIADAPGWRGFAWWAWTASEPRRVLLGAEHIVPFEWIWRASYGGFGVPGLKRLPGRASCLVESVGSYLARLSLLAPGERVRPAALEPERIAPFLEYDARRGSVVIVGGTDR
jgi:hypothetical protein